MTKQLSPAAKAVLDTVREICPAPADEIAAAALRAAADQVVPKESTLKYPEDYQLGMWVANDDARTELLAIAAELEAQ